MKTLITIMVAVLISLSATSSYAYGNAAKHDKAKNCHNKWFSANVTSVAVRIPRKYPGDDGVFVSTGVIPTIQSFSNGKCNLNNVRLAIVYLQVNNEDKYPEDLFPNVPNLVYSQVALAMAGNYRISGLLYAMNNTLYIRVRSQYGADLVVEK